MKIAVTGKGGVGKSTLAAALALLLAEKGERVVAVDADPDANLAQALGVPESDQSLIVPISRQAALIEERTGAKVNQYGQIFKINPEVSDLAGCLAFRHRGVSLLVLGAVPKGGGGCACAESVLLKALVADLILFKGDSLILDMEAGVEHLGRATAKGVDIMIVVVEPGQRSMDTARRIMRMAREIGLPRLAFVINKCSGPEDEAFARAGIAGAISAEDGGPGRGGEGGEPPEVLGVIPYAEEIRSADRDGRSVLDGLDAGLRGRFEAICGAVLA